MKLLNPFKKLFIYFPIIALVLPLFRPVNVGAKGGVFHVETITEDSFGYSDVLDFNDALEFGSYFYTTTDSFYGIGRIFRSSTGNSGDWTMTATAGFGDSNNTAVDAMVEFTNITTNLYVTTSNSAEGAEIWRSANGTDWTAVVGGGAAVNNGFGDPNNAIIRETVVFDDSGTDYLWAFTDNSADGAEFWRSTDGTTWNETTEPGFTDSQKVRVIQGFEYASRLYIFVLDNNDAESTADDVEVWYTTGGVTPSWNQLGVVAGTETFLNVVDDAAYLYFGQYGGSLYVGNVNNTTNCEMWETSDGDAFVLSQAFADSISVYPVSTSKGLIAGVGFLEGSTMKVGLYLYSGGTWTNTGIEASHSSLVFAGGAEFGDFYYAWGGFPGVMLRADMRPTTSTPDSAQTQLGDGVVEIAFTTGDITDADTLRAKVEYDIGEGYQKATLSENVSDISATYGIVDVENDNEYQVGNASGWITTSSGANAITVKWSSKIDEPTSNTTSANVRISISDGATSGAQKTESSVTVDNVNPDITSVNLATGQKVVGTPYFTIQTAAVDTAAGVWKVEFYIDDNLVCTDFVAEDGYYSCDWDTRLYHSDVRILAFDNVGNTDEEVYYQLLAETGESSLKIQGLSAFFLILLVLLRIFNYLKKYWKYAVNN